MIELIDNLKAQQVTLAMESRPRITSSADSSMFSVIWFPIIPCPVKGGVINLISCDTNKPLDTVVITLTIADMTAIFDHHVSIHKFNR